MALDETINVIGTGSRKSINAGTIGHVDYGRSTLSAAIAESFVIVEPKQPNFVRFQNNFKRKRNR